MENDIETSIKDLADDKLLEMLLTPGDYLPEALAVAYQEAETRGGRSVLVERVEAQIRAYAAKAAISQQASSSKKTDAEPAGPVLPPIMAAKTAVGAVLKILFGVAGFICGLIIMTVFTVVFLRAAAIIPIIAYFVLTIGAGRREARGLQHRWGYLVGLLLFTGLIFGMIGTAGVTMFLQGKAYFSQK